MNLTLVHDILCQLRATTSSLAKREILERNKQSEDLKEYFKLALDGNTLFYLTAPAQLPPPGTSTQLNTAVFEALTKRYTTGNAAKQLINEVLSKLTAEAQKVVCSILDKDPKCGVQVSTVNKVWPKLAWEFEVMKGDDIKDMDPTFAVGKEAEAKMDGRRALIVKEHGIVTILSSNGKPIYNADEAILEVQNLPLDNIVIDSEHFDTNWNAGSSLASSKVTTKTSDTWTLQAFDLLTLDEWRTGTGKRTFRQRKEILEQLLTSHPMKRVKKVHSYGVIRSVQHLQEVSQQAVDSGFEGLMLKDPHYIWQPKRDPHSWAKMKPTVTTDCLIVGFEPGKAGTKYEKTLGALICRMADGTLFNCGGGFSDQERKDIWARQGELLNTVVEVIEDYVRDRAAMKTRFPRFSRLRTDKSSL